LRVEQVAEIDGLARRVGQFDTDGVAAGDDGDARGGGGHGARDVFGERDDFRRAHAGGGLKFEQGDYGAGADFGDAALDAELGEDAAEAVGHFEQAGFIDFRASAAAVRRAGRAAGWRCWDRARGRIAAAGGCTGRTAGLRLVAGARNLTRRGSGGGCGRIGIGGFRGRAERSGRWRFCVFGFLDGVEEAAIAFLEAVFLGVDDRLDDFLRLLAEQAHHIVHQLPEAAGREGEGGHADDVRRFRIGGFGRVAACG
jgi:hypothetical protein